MEDQNAIQQRVPFTSAVTEHWNGAYMKKLRCDFIQGKDIPQCDHCWKDEAAGKVSGRLRRNQQYYGKGEIDIDDPVVADTINSTQDDGTYHGTPIGLMFATGNTCQLRCIDCSPAYSRSILKDYEKLGWEINHKARRHIGIHHADPDQGMLWRRIREVAPSVRWIRINGGEPSISQPLLDFLHWFKAQGHGQDVTIFMSINGVSLKPAFLDALKNFGNVKLEVSVDGYGAVDEYVRYPTNWDRKIKNIGILLEEFSHITIHTTVYTLNLGDIPNLLRWTETLPVLHSLQSLTWPQNLAIENLPHEYKSYMIDQLTPWIKDGTQHVLTNHYNPKTYKRNCVAGLINRLSQPGESSLWSESKKIINAYDTIRPSKLLDLIPSLKMIF